jgi:hypothetical protein
VKLGLAEDEKTPEAIQKPLQSGTAPLATVQQGEPEIKSEPVKLPTLADVEQLTSQSDFSSFMTQGVSPEVRNAAMKKLFTDPHYNVMDGLDIYIGDYNTPDPLPAGMLAKMVGAQFLGLVKAPEDVAQSDTSQTEIQNLSETQLTAKADNPEPLENNSAQHDHTHLRLQPNHAPADPETGSGAG